MKRPLLAILVTLAGLVTAAAASFAGGSAHVASAATTYHLPPSGQIQWFWDISPSRSGLAGLPSTTGSYPAPGSADVWDTDDFEDAGSMGSNDEPSGPSPVVTQLHAEGKYSICYIEAGAQQAEPDQAHFNPADYGYDAKQYQMQGYPGEYWFDTRGFASFRYGDPDSVLSGAAVNIAAGMSERIAGCAAEGQDALEPDDLDGYTNPGNTGVAGGGWGLTQADAAGYEAWLATTAHADGLAIFQKNDGANSSVDEPDFDGMIIEECNYYDDPCTGAGGDATAYLAAHKPVLNAEYTEDGESTAKFCPADIKAGITGALFNDNLDGRTYQPCAPVGGGSSSTTSTTSSSTSTTSTTTTTAPPPVNTGLPVITGTVRQGNLLRVSNGSWNGSPAKYAYTWKRCHDGSCSWVFLAAHNYLYLGPASVGDRLEAVVTASNSAGSTSATSAQTTVVTAVVAAKRSRSAVLKLARRRR